MGASDWNYVVEYQPDIDRALQQLRQREFEAGRFYRPAAWLTQALELGLIEAAFQPRMERSLSEFVAWPEPRSIAELLTQNGEEGTHSIIDIERLSQAPEVCAAAPLTPMQLLEAFGSARPTLETVLRSARAGALSGLRRRGEALYVVAHTAGQPSHIYFYGFSGD